MCTRCNVYTSLSDVWVSCWADQYTGCMSSALKKGHTISEVCILYPASAGAYIPPPNYLPQMLTLDGQCIYASACCWRIILGLSVKLKQWENALTDAVILVSLHIPMKFVEVRRLSPQNPGGRWKRVFVFLSFCLVCLCCYVFPSPDPTQLYFIHLWHDIAYICWKCR